MIKNTLSLLFFSLLITSAYAQNKSPYALFSSEGKKSNYKKLMKAALEADVILFGEFHNNPIDHWLQLELSKDLYANKLLILGAEMIESDNQTALDFYLLDSLDVKGLDTNARLWTNFKTDYLPLVDFAKENKLPFIATNIPRSYAKMVYKNDFVVLDTLPESVKIWIAPLPISYDPELPGYKNMSAMMGGHGTTFLAQAQAIKDATMAYFILKNRKEDSIFLHFNGAYHSNNYEGILWYLQQQEPSLKYLTISTVEQADLSELEKENHKLANFIIVVDEDMSKSY